MLFFVGSKCTFLKIQGNSFWMPRKPIWLVHVSGSDQCYRNLPIFLNNSSENPLSHIHTRAHQRIFWRRVWVLWKRSSWFSEGFRNVTSEREFLSVGVNYRWFILYCIGHAPWYVLQSVLLVNSKQILWPRKRHFSLYQSQVLT